MGQDNTAPSITNSNRLNTCDETQKYIKMFYSVAADELFKCGDYG